MIVDSSVIAAICLGEPDAESFLDLLLDTRPLDVGAATFAEAGVVIDARQPGSLDRFLNALDIEVVPFDIEQASIAREAYQQFGKGSEHQAQLNFGDCLSYATAVALEQPLLFKGGDFLHTDVPRIDADV
ncbi:MAG: VapC toxin family PIN domain ribonuclease [Micrococcales bacterium]|nr:VapC toxin family PIN domain ribonuclease [Micrococcales bacterium]